MHMKVLFMRTKTNNRPFPSSLVPVSKRSQNVFDLHENQTAYKTHFLMKGFALTRFETEAQENSEMADRIFLIIWDVFLCVSEIMLQNVYRMFTTKNCLFCDCQKYHRKLDEMSDIVESFSRELLDKYSSLPFRRGWKNFSQLFLNVVKSKFLVYSSFRCLMYFILTPRGIICFFYSVPGSR